MEEKELKILKLDEMAESIWNTFMVLFLIIFIISVINGYGIFRFVYTIGVMLVLFLIPILCIISGTLIMILRKLNYIKTDGDWGIFALMKSVYSRYWNETKDNILYPIEIKVSPITFCIFSESNYV